jgi:hypothetical protein
MSVVESTTIPSLDAGTHAWERPLRRFSVVLIAALFVTAAIGLLGVRTATVTDVGNGISVAVLHSTISRPGLATPFSIEISTVDGDDLPSYVVVLVSSDYLAIFDDNGMEPAPLESWNDAEFTRWSFQPDGPSIRVDLDARLEPSVQWARRGTVVVEIAGQRAANLSFVTWVAP